MHKTLLMMALAALPITSGATDPSDMSKGYDSEAAAAIAAIEAREAARESDGVLRLPAMRVRGKRRYNSATGTRLIGDSAPEGGVLYTTVDESYRAKHQW